MTMITNSSSVPGNLEKVEFETLPIFNFQIPKSCAGVPSEILNPRNTWANKEEYDAKAKELAIKFKENFKKYESLANADILDAAPKI
jgi:Phosphoenolpyruvate carboxykinase (ATP)